MTNRETTRRAAADTLEADYHALLFAVHRSIRYHRHRERFLDRVHDAGALLTAFGGSATVAAALASLPPAWAWALPVAALVTAFAGAHELVFATARTARRNDGLARDFVGLEEDLLRARPALTPAALIELQARRLDIEATEPPVYRALDATCNDELVTALGYGEAERTNVTWWQRWLRNLVAEPGLHRIRKRADTRG